ncbi:MAG: type II toxin-antitoxin system VapC family toxin [Acidobacteria bacterium]|nr:type II toxin-antitoxin system VapC family toxin [Acidobacteriota bacterium]
MLALDTNTLIYFFKGAGRVKDQLLATPPRDIAVPAVVVYELELGVWQSSQPKKRRAQLDEFLALTTILPLDGKAAKTAAELRADLEAAGAPIGPMDTLIAGIALAHGATLVTHNIREFRRVRGLKLVDWC